MNKHSNYWSWIRNTLIIGSLAVLVAAQWLPSKKLQLYPRADMMMDLFSDKNSGGNSYAYWLTNNQELVCDVEDSAIPAKYCGVSIKYHSQAAGESGDKYLGLRNINLSDYDKVNVDVVFEGPSTELRFFMRGTEATNGNDLSSAKFMFTYFEQKELHQAASAQLSQFSIPAWWLNRFYQSREDFQLDFSSIKEISFDIPSTAADGLYKIELFKVEAEGKWISNESLYASIIFIWLAYFSAEFCRYILHQKKRLTQSIHTLEQDVDELKHSASNDQLTGVLNRRGLLDSVEEHPLTGENHYLFVFDIDNFKQINDRYGHNNGDEVLRFFARQLSAAIRSQDIFARWGGEEFVLLSQHPHEVDAFNFAERLRELIYRQDFLLSNQGKQQHIKLSMSIGLTRVNKDEAFNHAFNRADGALYQAKDSGRNRSQLAS
ncbi:MULTISPECIES: GGDEF domain-containing protein [unclassified Agarivorans]|uniref:GGDEF domain-containing protein n=1 Tax=unclassified Agarivorans TaxID=2636026 RepID=UPI0026E39822|nr:MULTISPECIES: GGDEF domain-containing protein [unclassified Agarivorans]MDO6685781.1 GGDEF domain-containing protein [Agarivorans sp. 3_MG-2023]MDO6716104.1 GGDEF domain-containing protein [Agarivorans sp. 2_MG-2023]